MRQVNTLLNSRSSQTQLYLIADIKRTRAKLGVSKNPANRLKQLQTGSADRLILLATFPGSFKDERKFHTYLCTSKLIGEWFDWSDKIDIIIERWKSHRSLQYTHHNLTNMTTIWIINTENFQGHPIAKMCPENNNYVWGSHPTMTFEEYNLLNGGVCKQVTWTELNDNWLQPYLNNRNRWHQIATDNFFEMLGSLPPLKHNIVAGYETFFMSEFQNSNKTSVYIRNTATNKCYTSIRPIDITPSDLEESILSLTSLTTDN